jgi:hypothetical protein
VDAEWREVGSELEALVREAEWIAELAPPVNVQVGAPALDTRQVPRSLVRDTVVVLPSVEDDSVELLAARAVGSTLVQRTRRNGADLAVHTARLWQFFRRREPKARESASPALAPIVFSWLAGRGAASTRLDPHDAPSAGVLRARLMTLLGDEGLFAERIVVLDSKFRVPRRSASGAQAGPTPKRP